MFTQFLATLFVVSATLSSANQWSIISETSATTLIGVGAGRDDLAVCGAASNGVGSFVERYENGVWSKSMLPGGLLLDAAGKENSMALFPLKKSQLSF